MRRIICILIAFTFIITNVTVVPVYAINAIPASNDPLNIQFLQSFGQRLYERGDYTGAKDMFTKLLAVDPNNAKAIRYIGLIDEARRFPKKKIDMLDFIAFTNDDIRVLSMDMMKFERRNRDLEFAIRQLIQENDRIYQNIVDTHGQNASIDLNKAEEINRVLDHYEQNILSRDRARVAQNRATSSLQYEITQVNEALNDAVSNTSSSTIKNTSHPPVKEQHMDDLNNILHDKRSHMTDKMLVLIDKSENLEFFRKELTRIKQNLTAIKEKSKLDRKDIVDIQRDLGKYANDFTQLKDALIRKDRKIQQLSQLVQSKDQELLSLKNTIRALRQQLAQKDKTINNQRQTITYVENNLNDLVAHVKTIDQTMNRDQNRLITLKRSIDQVKQKLNHSATSLKQKDKHIAKLQAELKTKTASLIEAESKAATPVKIDNSEQMALARTIASKDHEIKKYKRQLADLTQRVNQLTSHNRSLKQSSAMAEARAKTNATLNQAQTPQMKMPEPLKPMPPMPPLPPVQKVAPLPPLADNLVKELQKIAKNVNALDDEIIKRNDLIGSLALRIRVIDNKASIQSSIIEEQETVTDALHAGFNAHDNDLRSMKRLAGMQNEQINNLKRTLDVKRTQSSIQFKRIEALENIVQQLKDKLNEQNKLFSSNTSQLDAAYQQQMAEYEQQLADKQQQVAALQQHSKKQLSSFELAQDKLRNQLQSQFRKENAGIQDSLLSKENELSALKRELYVKNQEIVRINDRLWYYKNQMEARDNIADEYERDMRGLRKHIAKLQETIDDQDHSLRAKDANAVAMKSMIKQLEDKADSDHEERNLLRKLEDIQYELDQTIAKIDQKDILLKKLEKQLKSKDDSIKNKDAQLDLLRSSLEEMKNQLASLEHDANKDADYLWRLEKVLLDTQEKLNGAEKTLAMKDHDIYDLKAKLDESKKEIITQSSDAMQAISKQKDLQKQLRMADVLQDQQEDAVNTTKKDLAKTRGALQEAHIKISSQKNMIDALRNQIKDSNDDLNQKTVYITNTETRYHTLSKSFENINKELEQSVDDLKEKDAEILRLTQKMKKEAAFNPEQIRLENAVIKQQKQEIAALQASLKALHEERAIADKNIEKEKRSVQDYQAKVNTLNPMVDRLKADLKEKTDHITSLKKQISTLKGSLKKQDNTPKPDQQLESDVNVKVKQIERLAKQLSDSEETVSILKGSLKEKEGALSSLKKELEDALKKLNDNEKILVKKTDKIANLSSLKEELEKINNDKQKTIEDQQSDIKQLQKAQADFNQTLETKDAVIAKLEAQLNKTDEQLKASSSDLNQANKTIANLRKDLEKQVKVAYDATAKHASLLSSIDDYKEEIDARKDALHTIKGNMKKLTKELNQTTTFVSSKDKRINTLQEELNKLKEKASWQLDKIQAQEKELKQYEADLKNKESTINIEKGKMTEYQTKITTLVEELSVSKNTLSEKSTVIDDLQKQIKVLEESTNDQSAALTDAQKQSDKALNQKIAQIERLTKQMTDAEETIASLKQSIQSKEAELKDLEKILSQTQKDLEKSQKTLTTKESKILDLSSLNDGLKQIESDQKALLKDKDAMMSDKEKEWSNQKDFYEKALKKKDGQINTLTDSLSKTQTTLDEAKSDLDASNDSLDQLRKELKEQEKALKEHSKKEASFDQSMEKVNDRLSTKTGQFAKLEQSYDKIRIELDEKVKQILRHDDELNKLRQELKNQEKAFEKNAQKDNDALNDSLDKLNEQLITKTSQFSKLEKNYEDLQNQLQDKIKQAKLNANVADQLRTDIKTLENRFKDADQEDDWSNLENTIKELQANLDSQKGELNVKQASLKQANDERDRLRKQVNNQDKLINTKQASIDKLNAQIDQLKSDLAETTKLGLAWEEDAINQGKQVDAFMNQISKIQYDLSAVTTNYQNALSKIDGLDDTIDDLNKRLKAKNKEIKRHQKTIDQLRKEIEKLKQKKQKSKDNINESLGIIERLPKPIPVLEP